MMQSLRQEYRVLALDDGSVDGTWDLLKKYQEVMPLLLLRAAKRKGYGASLRRLLETAAGQGSGPDEDPVVVLQADFTEDPGQIPTLLSSFGQGCDLVGSALEGPPRGAPLLARFRWRCARRMMRKIARDPAYGRAGSPLSGFRVYSAALIRRVLADPSSATVFSRCHWTTNALLLRAALPLARRATAAPYRMKYDIRSRRSRARSLLELPRLYLLGRSRAWATPGGVASG